MISKIHALVFLVITCYIGHHPSKWNLDDDTDRAIMALSFYAFILVVIFWR